MITYDQWKQALEDAEQQVRESAIEQASGTQKLTVNEFAKLVGCSEATASRRMKLLLEQGRAKRTQKMILLPNGGLRLTTAYELVSLNNGR